jgi:ABC-type transport system substrate-binding protein
MRACGLAIAVRLLASLAIVVAAACAPRPTEDEPDAADETIDAAGTTVEAQALVIGVRRLPASLDPLSELDPWGQRIVDDLVFEGLVRKAGDVAPFVEMALADACVLTPSEAPKHAWCHVRSDRVFHDGAPVTPADVHDALSAWLDPRRDALRARHGLVALERVELVDGPPAAVVEAGGATKDPGRWIHIEVGQVDPLLLERISAMKVWPKGKRRGSGTAFAKAPIGTGPMSLVRFDDTGIELARATTSPRTAGTVRLRLEPVADGAQALVRLRRGDLHIAAALPAAYVPKELAKPGMATRFSAWVLTPPRFDLAFYNLRRPPTATRALREALDAAVPRVALARLRDPVPSPGARVPVDRTPPQPIDLAGLHAAKAGASWGTHGLPAFPGDGDDANGKAAAASALDAAGWKLERGRRRRKESPLRLVLLWDGAPGPSSETASALKASWGEIGVHVPQATASFSYVSGLMLRGEFDVALARLSTGSDADLYPYFHSNGALNISGVADATLDEALERYRSAETTAARDTALGDVASRLDALRIASVLWSPADLMVASARVESVAFVDDLPQLDVLRLSNVVRWPPDPSAQ